MAEHRRRDAVVGKARILKARSLFCDMASRMADPVRARCIEAELNDAWLRLQFAIVTDDLGLEQSERRLCLTLLDEVRRGHAAKGARNPQAA
ncbi:hypothetical protein FHG66_14200 [Rubellimicrobium rubrum]|uniref:Uncharacterized protein n=1 Tax=Rubellimicrobium rubrum TaxID=2585369 RepID=A0A5C4MX39_9RHOB|nr:hypothetical protein [Rubellimicrobium rubrum]TNC48499.1 hypothetical protein FHG66_14200 [Rubellimicrobium rubrum]